MSGGGVALVEALVSLLIVVGAVFGLVGSYGLLKFPDLITRLHAPTKATTLGVGGVLVASMLYFWGVEGKFSWHELLVALFLFITAPVSANMIAKAWMHDRGAALRLPPTGTPRGWANDDEPDGDAAGDAPRDAPRDGAPR